MDDVDFDEIANDAVEEVFGFRGRTVAHPVHAWRAAHPGRVGRRDYARAGWGSPGWQASQGAYDPYYEDGLEEESDEVLEAEEDFGGDEFGRARHPARRARRHHRRKEHRQQRRQSNQESDSPLANASREPLDFDEDRWLPDEDFGQDSAGLPQTQLVPVPRQSNFRSALDTGLGFGLGFLGVAFGFQVIVSALSGGRR